MRRIEAVTGAAAYSLIKREEELIAEVAEMLNQFEEKHKQAKYAIVRSMLEVLPELKKKYAGKVNVCKECGEPAAKEVCNACNIVRLIKK